jgi:1,4-dihydroxy-2-naphthoate octaprenyltransferase
MTLREWWTLARPPTLPASVVPVAVGAAAGGARAPYWSVPVMLAVALLLQIATNMTNEYADWHRGVDHPGSVGIAGAIVSGRFRAETIRNWALGTYGMALGLGLLLVALRGPLLLVLGLLAIGAGFLYNAGPYPLSATAWGEVLVFWVMGPLEVLVSEVAVSGRATPTGFWASLTVGFMVAAILLANNLRDREDDAARGRRTLAIRLGTGRGFRVLRLLVVAGLAWPVVASLLGRLPWGSSATLLVVPWAWGQLTRLERPDGLRQAVLIVGRIHLAGGLLLALGLAVHGTGGILR